MCNVTVYLRRPAAVVHKDDDYLIISKPAGLPCMRHESNGRTQEGAEKVHGRRRDGAKVFSGFL